jgi:hypothetical protein
VNAVLRSFRLEAGAEILVINLGYGGVTLAASATAPKVLIGVQGASIAPDDDELVEAEQVQRLDGLQCLRPAASLQSSTICGREADAPHESRQAGRTRRDLTVHRRDGVEGHDLQRLDSWRDGGSASRLARSNAVVYASCG